MLEKDIKEKNEEFNEKKLIINRKLVMEMASL
jgi:hypothetical protein